jgi:polar amino acid transport system substrate-binding protein
MHTGSKWKVAALAAATATLAVLAATAAAQPTSTASTSATLVYCSDITYPPEEFYKGTTAVGSDIDIGTAIAKRLGMKAEFANTGFDGIIAALLGKKCDAIISGMNDTATRRKQVAFVDYLSVGQSLMVKKGNPHHIAKLVDLAGKSVSVEVGTTNKGFLDAESKKLQKAGKKSIQVVSFPKDTDAAAALKTGKVDAYFGDSPVVAYYIAKDSSFAFGGSPINPIPVGIALRRSDTQLKTKVQKAVDTLYANGSMRKILAKWKMSAFALKK